MTDLRMIGASRFMVNGIQYEGGELKSMTITLQSHGPIDPAEVGSWIVGKLVTIVVTDDDDAPPKVTLDPGYFV